MTDPTPSPRRFELGLVMAGAASAGTYTAGVVDFLIEALQAWQEAKATGDPSIPDHEVCIRAVAGTSAGGIVASLLAMLPFTRHWPIRDLATVTAASGAMNASRNLLYRSWVVGTGIHDMLGCNDLRDRGVTSLLNGEALARLADEAIADVRATQSIGALPSASSYYANPLQLYLSFTNMRGVPYVIRMIADEGRRGHLVTSHSDYAHFAVFGTGADEPDHPPAGALPVNRRGTAAAPADDGWDHVRDAALATSAFPCGFPARRFRNPLSVYRNRDGLAAAAGAALSVQIDLPEADADGYDFWCVDGGLLNNEPLEYVRKALHPDGHRGGHDSLSADHSLLLIDPFPDDVGRAGPAQGDPPDALDALFALIPMLRAHAAFRPQELLLALDDTVRSRYLLSPHRDTRRANESELASDGLAGFAGFVHEQLRMHDFQLGRRNCQKFLADHFHLHVDNPIVAPWVGRLADRGVLDIYHPMVPGPDGKPRRCRDLVPVVPLMPQVRREVKLRPWPTLCRKRDFQPVAALIRKRADIVVPELLRALLHRAGIGDRRLVNRVLRAVTCDVITRKVGRSLAEAVERDLLARGLM